MDNIIPPIEQKRNNNEEDNINIKNKDEATHQMSSNNNVTNTLKENEDEEMNDQNSNINENNNDKDQIHMDLSNNEGSIEENIINENNSHLSNENQEGNETEVEKIKNGSLTPNQLLETNNYLLAPPKKILNSVKRKRRSKNDFEGRSFKCPECGKGYLSMPALNNHRKNKHDYGKYGERKGRGRPRKEPLILTPEDIKIPSQASGTLQPISNLTYSKIEKRSKIFFEKEYRRPLQNEKIDLDYIKRILDIIFSLCKYNFYGIVTDSSTSYEQYPFFNFVISNWDNNKMQLDYFDTGKEEKSSEEFNKLNNNLLGIAQNIKSNNIEKVLLFYLKDCGNKTNREYFEILMKFVILFREGINLIHDSQDFTMNNDSQEIPNMLNDIIEKYFQPNFFFGIEMRELLEVITHFCHWLFINHFTSLKVTY